MEILDRSVKCVSVIKAILIFFSCRVVISSFFLVVETVCVPAEDDEILRIK
jgi:hypothetical protein